MSEAEKNDGSLTRREFAKAAAAGVAAAAAAHSLSALEVHAAPASKMPKRPPGRFRALDLRKERRSSDVGKRS